MASSCGQKRKREPGKRCVVMFCDKTNADGVSLHKFPRDDHLCLKWNQFVLRKRDPKSWTPGHGHICSGHFTPSDYESYAAKLAGFTSRLVLKKGAIPSIQPIPTPEQLQKARKITSGTRSPALSTSTCTYTSTTSTPRTARSGTALTKLRAHRVSKFRFDNRYLLLRCLICFVCFNQTMKHLIASTHDEGTADDLGADSTLSSDPGEQSAPESAMPILVNKATQKSLRIQKPERRNKGNCR
ncbi:MAG: hypothetical protein DSY43_06795 [Gammaproteobacteria bacterium]|nr:MAG: hypothetical protein DSY43_06795 [Gammaproteobacteria bacterium]